MDHQDEETQSTPFDNASNEASTPNRLRTIPTVMRDILESGKKVLRKKHAPIKPRVLKGKTMPLESEKQLRVKEGKALIAAINDQIKTVAFLSGDLSEIHQILFKYNYLEDGSSEESKTDKEKTKEIKEMLQVKTSKFVKCAYKNGLCYVVKIKKMTEFFQPLINYKSFYNFLIVLDEHCGTVTPLSN